VSFNIEGRNIQGRNIQGHGLSMGKKAKGRNGQRCGTKVRHRLVSPGSESRHAASTASGARNHFQAPVYQYAMRHGNGPNRQHKWQINPRKPPSPCRTQKRSLAVERWP
jgi:hypothetical protein